MDLLPVFDFVPAEPKHMYMQVRPSLELQAKHAIQLMDVQKAVLYLTAGEPAPQWLAVKVCFSAVDATVSTRSIKHIVLIAPFPQLSRLLYYDAGTDKVTLVEMQHKEAISSVVVLMLPGIDEHMFSNFKVCVCVCANSM